MQTDRIFIQRLINDDSSISKTSSPVLIASSVECISVIALEISTLVFEPITPELCQQAIATGAQFLLTPGTPLDVLRYCRDHEIALLPGVLTPTDVAVSMEYGYHAMKLFPAGSMPLRYLKDLQGPFDKTQFMAIGGVNAENAADFLRAGYRSIGLASALMPKAAVAAGDWQTCENQVRKIVEQVNAVIYSL